MNYGELNKLFVENFCDENGLITGEPVMLIYTMNTRPEAKSEKSEVNLERLAHELEMRKLTLKGFNLR